MRNTGVQKKTRSLALASLISALGVVLLYIGSLLEVTDLSMAALASMLVTFAVIELGGIYPWLVYAVTGVLSLVLLPTKLPCLFYVCFAGFYPILKAKFERLPGKLLHLLPKLAVFNLCLFVIWKLCLLFVVDPGIDWPMGIVVLLLEFTFLLYDFTLTRLILAYVYKWRKKFSFLQK